MGAGAMAHEESGQTNLDQFLNAREWGLETLQGSLALVLG